MQAILVMIIIGGIYFELQSPGIGFPSAAGINSWGIVFCSLYIDGFSRMGNIDIFGRSYFTVLELIVIPGFGVAGILGGIMVFTGLILALINNVDFDFSPVEPKNISQSILTVISGIVMGFAITIYLAHKIGAKGIFHRLALHTVQDAEKGFIGVPRDLFELVGREGIAATIMRPSGKVMIGNEEYDAMALYGYIEKENL